MVFSPIDIFTTSGSAILTKCWTNNVTKYDSSAFYNWEQDNLPIYDLDERTEFLWERMGKPTSSVPGYALVVSADVAATSCNTNVFTTVSACIAALPDVINAPFLIEVANFGSLGELKLSNLKCGPRGSIEIINRGFAKAEGTGSIFGLNYLGFTTNTPYQNYALASSIDVNGALGAGYGITLLETLYAASALSISTRLLSSTVYSTSDARLNGNFNVFASKGDFAVNNRLTAALSPQNSFNMFGSSPTTKAIFQPYEFVAATADGVNSYDTSVINTINSTEVVWGDLTTTTTGHEGQALLYTNKLSNLIIENCDVPIYIRNFLADGLGYAGNSDYGFLVRNSSKVYLDNCASVRNRKAGFAFDNSKVTILRDLIAYRNYDFDALGNRLTGEWNNKRKSDKFNTTYSVTTKDSAAGILAINSDVNFSSVSSFEFNSTMSGAPFQIFNSIIGTPIIGRNRIISLSRNANGIKLVNSKLFGGSPEQVQMSQPTQRQYNLKVESNVEAGVVLDNSILDWDGRIIALGNGNGIIGNNSVINLDKLTCRYNQNTALTLTNSKCVYGKNLYRPTLDTRVYQTEFSTNNQHIVLNNSNLIYQDTSSVYSNYGQFFCTSAFGVGKEFTGSDGVVPDIVVDNGSKAYFLNTTIDKSITVDGASVKGAAVHASNGSKVVFKGSKDYATLVKGPTTYASQKRKAGVFAGTNSVVNFEGPTVIGRYSVDALAENNSTINFQPHRSYGGYLDISGFNLTDPANHTAVELHSTRACLVADKGSIINMRDLGNYATHWARGAYGTLALLSGVDYQVSSGQLEYDAYTSGGSMQFYPNPNDSTHYGPASDNVGMTTNAMTVNPVLAGNYYYFNDGAFDTTKQNAFSGVTHGGVCVRATNGSKINVQNVHFPAGWWNPSGIIYDMSGYDTVAACNRTFIWNIADNSQLNANLVSLSGNHPADVGYHGPWGAWTLTNGATFVSGAPTGTPDTSSLSVLDYFGQCSANPYGKSSFQNLGTFRLYFSVDPVTNWLQDPLIASIGAIPQIFAQGYNFSGFLTASGNVSSYYPNILQRNASNQIVASGFYFASAFLDDVANKVMVDDSASNLFANAKHCSIDKSGLAKSVTIYFPYTNTFGGDSANSSVKAFGKGYKSSNTFDLERDN